MDFLKIAVAVKQLKQFLKQLDGKGPEEVKAIVSDNKDLLLAAVDNVLCVVNGFRTVPFTTDEFLDLVNNLLVIDLSVLPQTIPFQKVIEFLKEKGFDKVNEDDFRSLFTTVRDFMIYDEKFSFISPILKRIVL